MSPERSGVWEFWAEFVSTSLEDDGGLLVQLN